MTRLTEVGGRERGRVRGREESDWKKAQRPGTSLPLFPPPSTPSVASPFPPFYNPSFPFSSVIPFNSFLFPPLPHSLRPFLHFHFLNPSCSCHSLPPSLPSHSYDPTTKTLIWLTQEIKTVSCTSCKLVFLLFLFLSLFSTRHSLGIIKEVKKVIDMWLLWFTHFSYPALGEVTEIILTSYRNDI